MSYYEPLPGSSLTSQYQSSAPETSCVAGKGNWILEIAEEPSLDDAITRVLSQTATRLLLDYKGGDKTKDGEKELDWGHELCKPLHDHLKTTLVSEAQGWIETLPDLANPTYSVISKLETEIGDGSVTVSLNWTVGKHKGDDNTETDVPMPAYLRLDEVKALHPVSISLSRQPNPQELWKCEPHAA